MPSLPQEDDPQLHSRAKPQARGVETAPRLLLTLHSGLPLTWEGHTPVTPARSKARTVQLAIKRVMDVMGSLLALLGLLPLLLGVAIAIKVTSPGQVLFRQTREGLDGRPITVYKFRTMYTDRCDITGIAQTVADDPRVTPIGRFLRRTSIDELPQLFSILTGDMALIGPRPHAVGMLAGGRPYDELVPYYHLREEMKPGLSGWAQANGLRGPTDDAAKARARIDHDLAYIENFSLWLDLKIVWMTIRREFLGGSGV